jgi:hypothetical protein
MSYRRCVAAAVAAALCSLLGVATIADQVSTNKINPPPPAVSPSSPSAPRYWWIPIAAFDLPVVEVALLVTPVDLTPPWADLVSGLYFKRLPRSV